MRALIVGGGVGGLATANALDSLGIECVVIDQTAPAHAPVGGLFLWPNAVKVLSWLGLEEETRTCASVVENVMARSARGRTLASFDIPGGAANAPSLCLPQAELRRILAERLRPAVVRKAARCVSFAVRERSVIAHMADGSTCAGDLLVGADGIHSTVRHQLLGNEPLRYAGATCWRGLAPCPAELDRWDLPPRAIVAILGDGTHFAVSPCGPRRVCWFAVRNAPPRTPLDLSALADNWPEPVASMVRATPAREIRRDDLADRPPASTWGRGPVTLLGDAAHPTAPHLGQGACQTLADARALSRCLAEAPGLEDSLRGYERLRMPPTALLTRDSARISRVLQTESAWGYGLRFLALGSPFGQRMVRNFCKKVM